MALSRSEIRRSSSIELCDPKLFSRLEERPLLSNLKHLALLCDRDQFDLDKLKSFSQ